MDRYVRRPQGLLTLNEAALWCNNTRAYVSNRLQRASIKPDEYTAPDDRRLHFYRMTDIAGVVEFDRRTPRDDEDELDAW